jgi:hypothetical protein
MTNQTKNRVLAAAAVGMLATSAPVSATWLQGTVQEVRVIANNSPDDKVVVFISAPTGCTYNAFMLLPADTFFKESYGLMLAAKATGQPIKFDYSYCHSSGYARGNGYSLVD